MTLLVVIPYVSSKWRIDGRMVHSTQPHSWSKDQFQKLEKESKHSTNHTNPRLCAKENATVAMQVKLLPAGVSVPTLPWILRSYRGFKIMSFGKDEKQEKVREK